MRLMTVTEKLDGRLELQGYRQKDIAELMDLSQLACRSLKRSECWGQ